MKVIISGGGTGGHIFPAISIAEALKEVIPDTDLLFVGAEGKMEMERIPKAGFPIVGLPIRGLQRKLSWENLKLPMRVINSLRLAKRILKDFQPDVAVGVGGYASGPLLYMAQRMGIKTLIQEQNSYPGITNRLLSKRVDKICVAYPGMNRYFPQDRIVVTGNPVRRSIGQLKFEKQAAFDFFDLDQNKKTVIIFGGSLGARTINQAMIQNADLIRQNNQIQWVWQCGRRYHSDCLTETVAKLPHVKCLAFIDRMDMAYALADLVIARAGALSISEICLAGKPNILVPSPNVAEDHQTKNAQALVDRGASLMIRDQHADACLIPQALELVNDQDRLEKMQKAVKGFARPKAAIDIANEIIDLAND